MPTPALSMPSASAYDKDKFEALKAECIKSGHVLIFDRETVHKKMRRIMDDPNVIPDLIDDLLVAMAVCDYWVEKHGAPEIEALAKDIADPRKIDTEKVVRHHRLVNVMWQLAHSRMVYFSLAVSLNWLKNDFDMEIYRRALIAFER